MRVAICGFGLKRDNCFSSAIRNRQSPILRGRHRSGTDLLSAYVLTYAEVFTRARCERGWTECSYRRGGLGLVGVAAGAFGAHGLKSGSARRCSPSSRPGRATRCTTPSPHRGGPPPGHRRVGRAPRPRRRGGSSSRDRALLGQPLPPVADRPALARRHHPARRPGLPRRLALPRGGGVEGRMRKRCWVLGAGCWGKAFCLTSTQLRT